MLGEKVDNIPAVHTHYHPLPASTASNKQESDWRIQPSEELGQVTLVCSPELMES
jgi:hypothetical protein